MSCIPTTCSPAEYSWDTTRLKMTLTPTNPINNGQSMVNGEISFPLFLTSTGYVTLGATALNNTDIVGQSVTIPVEQGAQYVITVPPTATVIREGEELELPTSEIVVGDEDGRGENRTAG